MGVTTVIIVIGLPLACVVAASTLMRLFDVKDATVEQAQAQAEELLA